MDKEVENCSHTLRDRYNPCSRKAVVRINGFSYCKQHGLMHLPKVQVVPGIENKQGLQSHFISHIFSLKATWR